MGVAVALLLAGCAPEPSPPAEAGAPAAARTEVAWPEPVADVLAGRFPHELSEAGFDSLRAAYLEALPGAPNGALDRMHTLGLGRGTDLDADGRADEMLMHGCGLHECGAGVFLRRPDGYRYAGSLSVGTRHAPTVCRGPDGALVLSMVGRFEGTVSKSLVAADTVVWIANAPYRLRFPDDADGASGVVDVEDGFVPAGCDLNRASGTAG